MTDMFDQATAIEEQERERAIAMHRRCIVYGPSSSHCHACGEAIPEGRQKAIPGVSLYIDCQLEKEKKS